MTTHSADVVRKFPVTRRNRIEKTRPLLLPRPVRVGITRGKWSTLPELSFQKSVLHQHSANARLASVESMRIPTLTARWASRSFAIGCLFTAPTAMIPAKSASDMYTALHGNCDSPRMLLIFLSSARCRASISPISRPHFVRYVVPYPQHTD